MKLNYPFSLNRSSPQAAGLIYWCPGAAGVSNILKPKPSAFTGTIPTNGIWVPGYQGGKSALTFDGSTNRAHLLDASDYFTEHNKVTVACWIKTTDTGHQYTFQKWGQPGGTFHLRVNATTGLLYWTVSFNGSYQAANDLDGATVVNDGKWHLCAASFDGTTSKIFVDGRLDASRLISGTLFQTANEVYFGGFSDGNVPGDWFLGEAEDFRVWNNVLTDNVHYQMFDPSTRWELRKESKTTPRKMASVVRGPKPFTSMIGSNESLYQQEQHAIGADALNVIDRSASNTLTLSQTLSRNIVDNIDVGNTLTFTQTLWKALNGVFYITSGTTFVAPGDWPGQADYIECVGGGGGGGWGFSNPFNNAGGGGGGGAYSKKNNVTVADGAQIQIGTGGLENASGTDTWFGGTSVATSQCGAKAGTGGNASNPISDTNGVGGAAASGVGDTKYSGGAGGDCSPTGLIGGGGGGSAGPYGNGGHGASGSGSSAGPGGGGNGGGGNGVTDSGGNSGAGGTAWNGTPGGVGGTPSTPPGDGSQGSGGGGGTAVHGPGAEGGPGNDFDSAYGTGGGGGGADTNVAPSRGGHGGNYGGGGGGGAYDNDGGSGHGAPGLIVVKYHTYISRSVGNTLNLTQEAIGATLNPQAENTLALTQTARGFSGTKIVLQSLTLTGTATSIRVYLRSASNTLLFNSVGEGVRINPASNTLTFTQQADDDLTKGAYSALSFSQSATYNYTPHLDYPTNTLVITQSLNKGLSRPVASTITFTGTALGSRVKFRSASNLLVMTHNVTKDRIGNTSSTLNLTHDADGYKIVIASVSNALSLSHTVSRSAVYTFSLTDSLAFLHTYIKPTEIQGEWFNFAIPEVVWSKTRNRVSFRTKTRAIVLRPPLLGDGEGGTGKIVLQRTISGATYVYARRTSTRLLNYTFEADYRKAMEMKRFMLDCMSEPIWLENWKGEVWVGFFTSNPFQATTVGRAYPEGDAFTFDVEFEGARVH